MLNNNNNNNNNNNDERRLDDCYSTNVAICQREQDLMIVAITCAQSELLMCLIRPTTDGDNNQFIYFLSKYLYRNNMI
jgi:hypothetical protein